MTITADLRAQALHVAGSVDPEVMTGAQAAAAVEDLAVAEKALAGTLLFLALRVAQTDAWRGQGHRSAADWLASKAGISVAEAARQLGTAKQADRLPKTKKAMKEGDLSPDQANAVAGAATADPDAEDDLLSAAANDTNQALRDKAAKAKAAATDSDARERRIRARRSMRSGTDPDGAFWMRLYGPGVDAATVEAMLRPFEQLVFEHGRRVGSRDTYENRRYDAFVLMLAFLQAVAADRASGDGAAGAAPDAAPEPAAPDDPPTADAGSAGSGPPATGGPPAWAPPWDPDRSIPLPAKLPGGNNVKVIVLVGHRALLRGHTEAGETCEIAGVGPISVEAARAILRDDPFLAVVVRKGRDVVNVAHHGRGLNAHQRTAIEAGGLRCTNIACNQTVGMQIDHRLPYAADPITALANSDPLCPTCHPKKTHHGHELEVGSGRRRFLAPGHPDHPGSTDRPDRPDRPDKPRPRSAAPLDQREADALEARLRRRLASRGIRVEQPSLC